MREDVFRIITENLTNERLDAIIMQTEEYQQAQREENQMAEILERTLSKTQYRAYNEFLTAENNRTSVYITLCYQQGMKDILRLLLSLVGSDGESRLSIPLPAGTLNESGD